MKPYRPSSGFEHMEFQERFCVRCRHDENDDCLIHTTTQLYDAGHPDYPKEWVQDEQGPRCTAFEEDA